MDLSTFNSIKSCKFYSVDFSCQIFTDVITSRALNEFTKEVKFVDHMSRRFGAICKHNMSSGDTVDIQRLSRLMMFDILYGKCFNMVYGFNYMYQYAQNFHGV